MFEDSGRYFGRREPRVNSQGRPCLDYHIFKTKKIGAISYIVIKEKTLFYHFICLALRDIFVTTTFGDIVSFCCLGKTSRAFSRERTTFSIANFDYKTIQDFTRKQCQLKSADQANTHTHTDRTTALPYTHAYAWLG